MEELYEAFSKIILVGLLGLTIIFIIWLVE